MGGEWLCMTEVRLEKPARARLQRAFVAVNRADIGVRMLSYWPQRVAGESLSTLYLRDSSVTS